MIVQDSQTGALHQVPDHLSGYGDYGDRLVYDGLGNPVGRLSGPFDFIGNALKSVVSAIPGVGPAVSAISAIPGIGPAIKRNTRNRPDRKPAFAGRRDGAACSADSRSAGLSDTSGFSNGSGRSDACGLPWLAIVSTALASWLGASAVALHWAWSAPSLHALRSVAGPARSRPGLCPESSTTTSTGSSAASLALYGRRPASSPPSSPITLEKESHNEMELCR